MKMACGDRKAAFRVAILDPEVTLSQPAKVTALTGIDALSHALESYVTAKRNPLSQMFAREAWKLLESNLEKVLANPTDLQARGAMQMGAYLAGIAIENSMLGACHACANPLTAHYGITHGLAIGILLPHVIRFNARDVGTLYGELVEEVGLRDGQAGGVGRDSHQPHPPFDGAGRAADHSIRARRVARHLRRVRRGSQPAMDRSFQSTARDGRGHSLSL